MIAAKIKYLWMDCVCLNQDDKDEMDAEVLKMYEYVGFSYYYFQGRTYVTIADVLIRDLPHSTRARVNATF